MKNKKALNMVASLALVGALGLGATLAYLSDKTDSITNTFTIGKNVDIQISEGNYQNPKNRIVVEGESATQEYTDLNTGVKYTKDPRVDMKQGSNEAYIFMNIAGLDEFLAYSVNDDDIADLHIYTNNTKDVLSEKWVKVSAGEGKDGTYLYVGDGGKSDPNTLSNGSTASLFDQIEIDSSVVSTKNEVSIPQISVKAAAVQSTNVTVDDAIKAVADLF